MIYIKSEMFNQNSIDEIFPLLQKSKVEVFEEGNLFNSIKDETLENSNIDFNSFIDLSINNCLQYTTLRDENKKLIGYCSFTIYHSPFVSNSDFKIADLFSLYIEKEHRSFKLFKRLLEANEKFLKLKNVKNIYMNMPISHVKLMNRLNFKEKEVTFLKEL